MLRTAARATAACGAATATGVASAPMLLSGTDNALLPALTPLGATLAVDVGWTNASQRIALSYPREGLEEAKIEIEGSLLWLLAGGSGKYSVRARGRGVRVRSDGEVQLDVRLAPDEPGHQKEAGNANSSSSSSSGGSSCSSITTAHNSSIPWEFPELALCLPSPTTVTVEIEDTSIASVEALEQLSSLHPFAADLIMAGAGPAATASPCTIDTGSQLRLRLGPAPMSRGSGGNCPRASAICASGSIPGRAEHSAILRHSGDWVDRLLMLLAESGLTSRDNNSSGASVEIDVTSVQLAHSALRWQMENGTVHFSRADLLINQQIRLASYGSYTFTGDGRKIEAVLAVPAVTLRQIQVLRPGLTDDREGVVMNVELTLPEPPPRGYYRNATSGGDVGANPKLVQGKAASSVDWVRAVQWGDVAVQLGALSARSMAAQLKQSTNSTRRSVGFLDSRLLANAALAVVNKTAPKPQLLPRAPVIPGVDVGG